MNVSRFLARSNETSVKQKPRFASEFCSYIHRPNELRAARFGNSTISIANMKYYSNKIVSVYGLEIENTCALFHIHICVSLHVENLTSILDIKVAVSGDREFSIKKQRQLTQARS